MSTPEWINQLPESAMPGYAEQTGWAGKDDGLQFTDERPGLTCPSSVVRALT